MIIPYFTVKPPIRRGIPLFAKKKKASENHVNDRNFAINKNPLLVYLLLISVKMEYYIVKWEIGRI